MVLTGTRREAAEEVAAELNRGSSTGAHAHGAACDVTDDASVADLVHLVRARCGRLDILVNNAGVGFTALLRSSRWTTSARSSTRT